MLDKAKADLAANEAKLVKATAKLTHANAALAQANNQHGEAVTAEAAAKKLEEVTTKGAYDAAKGAWETKDRTVNGDARLTDVYANDSDFTAKKANSAYDSVKNAANLAAYVKL